MNRKLYIAFAAVLTMLAACTKQPIDPTPQVPDSSRSYIFFEPTVNETVESKANLVEGETLPIEANTAFGVVGYCGTKSLFSAYENGIAQVYRPDAIASFQYDNLIFWQDPTAEHDFYAFYPYSINAKVTNETDPYITYTQPTANDASMVDLMTAYTSTAKCNLVGLEFNHRLWALDVVITNTQTDGINGSDEVITDPTLTINSISVKVEGFPTEAKIYLNPTSELEPKTALNAYTYTHTIEGGDVLTNSGVTATGTYGSFLFLPVKTFKYSLEIAYKDSRGVESSFSTGAAKTIAKEFEAGKRYKLTVNKTNDTFVVGTLTPSDWTDQSVDHEFN